MKKELTLRFKEIDGTIQTLRNITSLAINELGSVDFVQRVGAIWPNAQCSLNVADVESIELNNSDAELAC